VSEQRYNLGLELFQYVEDLYNISRICERPTPDNEKCIQCREKERVIDRLREMLLKHYDGTPYRERIATIWPRVEQPERPSNHVSVQRAVTGED